MTNEYNGADAGARGADGWQPLPQGEYDSDATAFVQLPPDGFPDAPLAAPGHGYVPPQITVSPATGAAATDPAATGVWVLPSELTGVPGDPGTAGGPGDAPERQEHVSWPAAHPGAESYGGGDAAYQDPGARSHTAYQEPGADPYGAYRTPGHGPYAATPEPYGSAHGETGQWSIPVADGVLPEESGEFTTSSLAAQWGDRMPPATLPGGAPAPWAAQPWAQPGAEPGAEPGGIGGAAETDVDVDVDMDAEGDEYAAERALEPDGDAGAEAGPAVREPERARPEPEAASEPGAEQEQEPEPEPEPAAAGPDAEVDGASEARAGAAEARAGASEGEPALDAQQTLDAQQAPDAQQTLDAQQTPDAQQIPDVQQTPDAQLAQATEPASDGVTPLVAEPAPGTGHPSNTGLTPDPDPAQDAVRTPDATRTPHGEPEPDGAPASADEPASADAQALGEAPESADEQALGEAPASADEPAPGDEGSPAHSPAASAPLHDDHPVASYVLRVNGTDRPVTGAWIGESLLYVLRERLGLAGAKDGCSQGECGACNVQVDGRLVASCLVPAATTAGSEVRTVEGLADDGGPSDVQRALAACGAVQCGFCVPGMAMTVHDLLEGNPDPTDLEARQALCGNLCRCSGYRGVLDAVRQVAGERQASHQASQQPPAEPAEPPAGDGPRIPHQAGPAATEDIRGDQDTRDGGRA